jgi:4'-phosphopantetheinyl transferase
MPRSQEGFEVVVARLDASPDEVGRARARLSGAERERARRFRFERDRRRYIVARARLRELLAARLGVRPEAVELEYGRNGKPRLAHGGWRFNTSHSEDVALFAFSSRSEIGVDIEAVRAVPEADAIAAQFFSPRERAAYLALAPHDRPLGFLKCWTRKEAVSKALGSGLSIPFEALEVSSVYNFSPLPGFIAALAFHHG